MIFFFDEKGTLIRGLPETIKQGSNKSSRIWLFMPISPTNFVNAYFTLPNGEVLEPIIMTRANEVPNVEYDKKVFSCWFCDLKRNFTRYAGTLKMSFEVYAEIGENEDIEDETITTDSIELTVSKGVFKPLDIEKTYTYEELMSWLGSNVITREDFTKEINRIDEAIDDIDLINYQPKTDNSLETESKEIVGAINEVNSKVGQNGGGISQEELDKKLDKPTIPTAGKAVVTMNRNTGEVSTLLIEESPASRPDWMPKYLNNDSYGDNKPNGTGTIIVPDPIKPYQSANKKYVDENKGTQLYKHSFTCGSSTSKFYQVEFISNESRPHHSFVENGISTYLQEALITTCYQGFGSTIRLFYITSEIVDEGLVVYSANAYEGFFILPDEAYDDNGEVVVVYGLYYRNDNGAIEMFDTNPIYTDSYTPIPL